MPACGVNNRRQIFGRSAIALTIVALLAIPAISVGRSRSLTGHKGLGLTITTTPSWTKVSTPGVPLPGLFASSAAYDPIDRHVILFGGSTGKFCDSNAAWSYSAGKWTKLSPHVSPPPRELATMSFDAADGYLVLFGGYDSCALS